MKYKLIIFDFDGTLADSFPWLLSVMEHIVKRFNLPDMEKMDPETIKRLGTQEALKAYRIPVWKAAIISRYIKKMMNEEIHRIQLFNNIDMLLRDIHRSGMKLACVSSNSYQNVQQALGQELAGLFEYYECGVSLFGKTGKFKKIVRQCGVMKLETLCIGDEIRDIQAARQADIPFGAVSWGYSHPSALQAHHQGLIFDSVEELYQAIFQQLPDFNQAGQESTGTCN